MFGQNCESVKTHSRRIALPAVRLASFVALAAGCAINSVDGSVNAEKLTPGIFLEDPSRDFVSPGFKPRAVSQSALSVTKLSEGYRSRPYNDAARYCSIGYGHLIKKFPCDGSEPDQFNQALPEPEGAQLLMADMELAEASVMRMVTRALTDPEYGALCDFVYNIGSRNFGGSTLLRIVNKGEDRRVPGEMRRWIRAGGKEFAGLKTRREREIQLYFEGRPTPEGGFIAGEDQTPIDIQIGEVR